MAGCIATIGRDGTLQVIQGLVKPEDMPKETGAAADGEDAGGDGEAETETGRVDGPAITTPLASPVDPRAKARDEAGVGIGLADDLRAIRTALIKAHLAGDFEAAFGPRRVPARACRVRPRLHRLLARARHRLQRDRRPPQFADERRRIRAWSPGETMLADWSHLPFEWMEGDDDAACFAALRALPRADKETLFAAAVARTVKGQLAFEHGARPNSKPLSPGSASTSRSTCVRPPTCCGRASRRAASSTSPARRSAPHGPRPIEVQEGRPRQVDGGRLRGRSDPAGPGRHGARRRARLVDAGIRGVRYGRCGGRHRRTSDAGRPARKGCGRILGCQCRPRVRGDATEAVGGGEHRVPGRRRAPRRRDCGRGFQ